MVQAPEEESYPFYRWVVIALVYAYAEANSLVTISIGVLLPLMRQELLFGPVESGWLGSARYLASGALALPLGVLLVRYNPRLVFLASVVSGGIFTLILGWAPIYPVILFGLFASTVGFVGAQPALALLRIQWFPKRELGRVLGVGLALGSIGQGLAVALTPFLVESLGSWRSAFYVYAAATLVVAVAWAIFGRERITPEYKAAMRSREARAPIRSIFRYREISLIGGTWWGNLVAWAAMFTFWPTYLLEYRDIPLTTAGILMGLFPIGSACATLFTGFLSDKIGLRRPIIWPAALIEPVFYLSMLLPLPVVALAPIAFMTGCLSYAPLPALQTIPYEIRGIKPSEVAVGSTFISMVTMWGGVVGPLIASAIYAGTGSLALALVVTSFFPLTLATGGFLLPETGPRRRREEEARVLVRS